LVQKKKLGKNIGLHRGGVKKEGDTVLKKGEQ